MSDQNPLNYSTTQRILLLIDLNPLLQHQNPNPNPYLSSLFTSIKTLLSFPPLSLSLSSFKLFFSSLSPLISSSILSKLPASDYNPNYLSFNHPNETLISLSRTLVSLRDLGNLGVPGSIPRALFMANSMAQAIHDYAWDLCDSDSCNGTPRSNLVVLFSPVCRSFNDLCCFMDFASDNIDNVLSNRDVFGDKFRGFFGYVRDAFASRDIHFSWVDVKYEIKNSSQSNEYDDYDRFLSLLKSRLKGFSWGFASSSSIVLGSALIPFGLIYPSIGVPSICYDVSNSCRKTTGQLNLEILDVNGKPMECKYCDLKLFDLKSANGHLPNELTFLREFRKVNAEPCHQLGGILEGFNDGLVKIDVRAICRHNELPKFDDEATNVVIVQEFVVDLKKNKEESSDGFFADRVLDLLLNHTNENFKRKSPPLWQILLSFLYRRGYWALVSLSNGDNSRNMGILKPFNFSSAFLVIPKIDIDSHCEEQFGVQRQILGLFNSEITKSNQTNRIDPTVNGMVGVENGRKFKKHSRRYKNISWDSFCKASYEDNSMELEEVYFSKGCETSKKLKFFKCWMKQVLKNGASFSLKLDKPKVHSLDPGETGEELNKLPKESQQLVSSFAEYAGKGTQIEDSSASMPGAVEVFFGNLSERIQQGIESGVDLVAFAHRVVHSCIYWLGRKLGTDANDESQAPVDKSDCSSNGGQVASRLIKILLKDPKYVVGRHKGSDKSSEAPDAKLSRNSSERVREYELQIWFRMEILQSEVALGIKDSTKRKFVDQICILLELIQCNMEDGFFGDFNLNDYVDRTIRSRYVQNLEDVVNRIYEQMDLLLFDDEDESPNPLFNSEDSSQSWRVGDNDRGSEPNSTEDSLHGPLGYNERSREANGTANHDQKLVKAQERRERASRFASFSRRAMPELQRVWAPKPQKQSMSKSDSFRKSKRNNRQRKSNDMVCETPTSRTKKCLFPSEDIDDGQMHIKQGDCSTGFAHKALFKDESLYHDWSLNCEWPGIAHDIINVQPSNLA